ncbi:MAG: flavin reductase family protein [Ignavibacteriaceae bacterium]
MRSFNPKEISQPEFHRLMLGGIGPRPIALVSTISEDGKNNLSPFSFFNAFGSNPPVVAFSPARRGRDASLKDTYNNLVKTGQCVVQAVTYSIVNQVSIASTEYDKDVDEFIKSGLTPVDSVIVSPKRVKESPFQMECRLLEMKSIGSGGGSANIAICEILLIHTAEDIFKDGLIQPELIDLVGRMSGNYYCRANAPNIFEVIQPGKRNCIGYDQIPDHIKQSHIFSANDLGKFAFSESVPDENQVMEFIESIKSKKITEFETGFEAFCRYEERKDFEKMLKAALLLIEENYPFKKILLEKTAKSALEKNDTDFAFKTAVYSGRFGN